MAARLVLDALVADLYGLHPDDLDHIADAVPDLRQGCARRAPVPAARGRGLSRRCVADGPRAAGAAADGTRRRSPQSSVAGFGLDELWQPEGGWEQANREARAILDEAGLR